MSGFKEPAHNDESASCPMSKSLLQDLESVPEENNEECNLSELAIWIDPIGMY